MAEPVTVPAAYRLNGSANFFGGNTSDSIENVAGLSVASPTAMPKREIASMVKLRAKPAKPVMALHSSTPAPTTRVRTVRSLNVAQGMARKA